MGIFRNPGPNIQPGEGLEAVRPGPTPATLERLTHPESEKRVVETILTPVGPW